MDIGGVHAADMPGTMHADFKQSDNAVIFKPDTSHALAFESARIRASPRSQERSKIEWIGWLRLKMMFWACSIWLMK